MRPITAADSEALDRSYAFCRKVARERARNFYYSFVLLSPQKKNAMCAVYAFMRHCDDLSDEPAEDGAAGMRCRLDAWRAAMDRALAGVYGEHPVWPALHRTVQHYGIPPEYLHHMIDGVTSDLEPRRIATFEELYRYCYQVASVVGMTVIHIFGFDAGSSKESALRLAEKCGIAFQLTNIMRDVREDAERDRIYLPAEDLERFQVSEDELRKGQPDERFRELMRFQAARARAYYDESQPLPGMVDRTSRASLRALIGIYSKLLERIEGADYDVLSRRIRLTPGEKAWLVIKSAGGWGR